MFIDSTFLSHDAVMPMDCLLVGHFLLHGQCLHRMWYITLMNADDAVDESTASLIARSGEAQEEIAQPIQCYISS